MSYEMERPDSHIDRKIDRLECDLIAANRRIGELENLLKNAGKLRRKMAKRIKELEAVE